MNTTVYGPAVRLALALGLVGVWLIPPSTLSAGTPGPATAAVAPESIWLAQAGAEPVERPVSYSNDQAHRGQQEYKSECEECHGGDLKGGLNGGAPLRGLMFEQKFLDGLPASVLFAFMSSTMPPNSPGRFSPTTYADLMAFILKRNGIQPGAPLPSDLDALDYMIIDK